MILYEIRWLLHHLGASFHESLEFCSVLWKFFLITDIFFFFWILIFYLLIYLMISYIRCCINFVWKTIRNCQNTQTRSLFSWRDGRRSTIVFRYFTFLIDFFWTFPLSFFISIFFNDFWVFPIKCCAETKSSSLNIILNLSGNIVE